MKKIVTLTNISYLTRFKEQKIDGIIIGQENFSNRFNSYFNNDKIENIKYECNKLGLELYINLNNIFYEKDIINLKNNLIYLKSLKVDGIYFNDLAIIQLAKELNMIDLLIYHPDTLLTNTLDIKFYLDQNLKGVCLSNEITLEDINEIAKYNDSLHLIIHGRINLSYSRRKFIKTYFEEINREYKYDNNLKLSLIESTRDKKMPILENDEGTSIFSDYTLESFNEIKLLKIEYMIIDDIFMNEDELFDTIALYNNELDYKIFINKYLESNYSSGFYYQKTNLVK